MEIQAVIITLLAGLSFFVGYLITTFVKNEKKMLLFAIGFAFSIILGLSFFDILPECLEMENKWIMAGCMIGGIAILKILDLFVPAHEHSGNEVHLEHIGFISSLVLFIHNTIEGTAIYTTALTDIKMGALMALGVSFHNIPLGIQISSMVHKKSIKNIIFTILAFSSVLGIIIIKAFNVELTELISGILISITFGMLMYILIFELLHEVKEHIKEKEIIIGILSGALMVGISSLIGLIR